MSDGSSSEGSSSEDSSDSYDDFRPIIIDNGTEFCRAGFAGADFPKVVLPSCVERLNPGDNPGHTDCLVGEYAADYAASPTNPIQHGIVSDWDGMEQIWHHVFLKCLRVAPENHCVLLTDTALNPKWNREKMVEMMFEKFGFLGVHIIMAAIPCLYASGRTTGVVVDSGGGSTSVVPIYEGYPIPSGTMRTDLGGSDVTDHLTSLLAQRGFNFSTPRERKVIEKLKEELARVAYDYDAEVKKELELSYVLPDGQNFSLGHEIYLAPEILFRPQLLRTCSRACENSPDSDLTKVLGASELVCNSIKSCELDLRKDLYHNIILSGGNTFCKGFKERLERDIQGTLESNIYTKIVQPPERLYSTWIGCSIIASLGHNSIPKWITRDMYDEFGPTIVHAICV